MYIYMLACLCVCGGVSHEACRPELDPWNSHGRRRESILALISIHMPGHVCLPLINK